MSFPRKKKPPVCKTRSTMFTVKHVTECQRYVQDRINLPQVSMIYLNPTQNKTSIILKFLKSNYFNEYGKI